MTEPKQQLVGTTLGDKYNVTREIGAGSMGAVYEARHVLLGRRVAIKVLKHDCSSPQARERFFNEARAAGAISHQHIVQVYDYGLVSSGEPYLVMEYVDGESLQAYMNRACPLELEDTIEICAQLLSALEVIHGIGLVHRDVKPGNIILFPSGRSHLFIKLLDFGIARAISGAWEWPTLTRADEVLGTPVYLSPEQAEGGKPDPRWDLWAVGIMLYEMLSGMLPFPTYTLLQITEDIVNHNFVPIERRCPDLPAWLVHLQHKAMHELVDYRFQTAADFLLAMEQREKSPLLGDLAAGEVSAVSAVLHKGVQVPGGEASAVSAVLQERGQVPGGEVSAVSAVLQEGVQVPGGAPAAGPLFPTGSPVPGLPLSAVESDGDPTVVDGVTAAAADREAAERATVMGIGPVQGAMEEGQMVLGETDPRATLKDGQPLYAKPTVLDLDGPESYLPPGENDATERLRRPRGFAPPPGPPDSGNTLPPLFRGLRGASPPPGGEEADQMAARATASLVGTRPRRGPGRSDWLVLGGIVIIALLVLGAAAALLFLL